ncbi:hypothetical protein CXB51_009196 [Gossypium anomalum]|uniref:Uncharacterized protein n=1 Tax=Gossypium anomalum TaxID=47600 RepID=A0A8J5YTZ5_9ROSI|nr:hypothetical protein CXB51_009196 [Gossypium anomalum]
MFEWTPYDDPAIRAVIPDEYVQNPNAWHVKVPLVNYVTVEMHESDKVLRQFRFRQPIFVAPEVFDEEHKVDLRLLNMDWPRYWSGYIEMWENRYDYIPTRESIIVLELACVPEYMPWFRINSKPYLLSEEERRRQIRVQRERRGPLNQEEGTTTQAHQQRPHNQQAHQQGPYNQQAHQHRRHNHRAQQFNR